MKPCAELYQQRASLQSTQAVPWLRQWCPYHALQQAKPWFCYYNGIKAAGIIVAANWQRELYVLCLMPSASWCTAFY
jgi:hypothetical protein